MLVKSFAYVYTLSFLEKRLPNFFIPAFAIPCITGTRAADPPATTPITAVEKSISGEPIKVSLNGTFAQIGSQEPPMLFSYFTNFSILDEFL